MKKTVVKRIKHPNTSNLQQLLKRPDIDSSSRLKVVQQIMENVLMHKDAALLKYAEKFDHVKLSKLQVTSTEVNAARKLVSKELQKAITIAYENIQTFHRTQLRKEKKVTTTPGVSCWRESRPIETVGLYIPGGSAPLFSTVLMLATPATIAGCKNLVLCSPPDKNGQIHPAILFTANLCGINKIYKTGGAQAIAAMAYGTETIPKCDKIFGPGNSYVTLAKQLVQQHGVAIDMPAGPSEVMVVADESCVPEFVAADLLSQAEHGPDSQVVLLTWNQQVLDEVQQALNKQTAQLPRKEIALQALKHAALIGVKNKAEALAAINAYAPEHLILAVKNERYFIKHVQHAGSVFIGNYTPESAGDYASGTNHTLPTNGYARMYSGVSVDSFVKKITFQKITAKGLKQLGPVIEIMAEAEQLQAHRNAVSIRLKHIKNKR